MVTHNRVFSIMAALALLLPSLASAQSDTAQMEAIDEIIVSATRTGQPATAIAGTINIIDKEALRQQVAISDDLASVLSSTIPGFAPSSQ
ncbi:MAG: TonB-dependent receptor, partial [Pseudomonadota bacterium]